MWEVRSGRKIRKGGKLKVERISTTTSGSEGDRESQLLLKYNKQKGD